MLSQPGRPSDANASHRALAAGDLERLAQARSRGRRRSAGRGAVPSANRVSASQPIGWRVARSQIGWKTGRERALVDDPADLVGGGRAEVVRLQLRPEERPGVGGELRDDPAWCRAIHVSGEAVCVETRTAPPTVRPRYRIGARPTTPCRRRPGRSMRGSTRPLDVVVGPGPARGPLADVGGDARLDRLARGGPGWWSRRRRSAPRGCGRAAGRRARRRRGRRTARQRVAHLLRGRVRRLPDLDPGHRLLDRGPVQEHRAEAGGEALLEREVALDADVGRRPAVGPEHGRERRLLLVERAVLAPVDEDPAPRLAGGEPVPHVLVHGRRRDPALEHARVAPQQLVGGVAADGLEGRVDVGDRAREVGDHHGLGGVVDGAPQLVVPLLAAQRLGEVVRRGSGSPVGLPSASRMTPVVRLHITRRAVRPQERPHAGTSRPCRRAAAGAGRPCAAQPDLVEVRARRRPITSSAVQPKSRSAAGFQPSTMPSRSIVTAASGLASMAAWRCDSARDPRRRLRAVLEEDEDAVDARRSGPISGETRNEAGDRLAVLAREAASSSSNGSPAVSCAGHVVVERRAADARANPNADRPTRSARRQADQRREGRVDVA